MPNREALHIKQQQIIHTQQKIGIDRQMPPREQILRSQSQTIYLNAPYIKIGTPGVHVSSAECQKCFMLEI